MARRPGKVSTVTTGRGVAVSVEGLTELRRDLRAVDDKRINRRLTKRLKQAAEVVADNARSRVPTGPDVRGHVTSSIRAGAGQRGAWVQGGKDSFPYYGWLDFGSRTPNGGSFNGQSRTGRRALSAQISGRRVGPWAASGSGPKGGRFIYPAIDAKSGELVEQTRKAVDETLKEVNL